VLRISIMRERRGESNGSMYEPWHETEGTQTPHEWSGTSSHLANLIQKGFSKSCLLLELPDFLAFTANFVRLSCVMISFFLLHLE